MKKLDENGMPMPESLGRAERSMREAEDALRRGDPREAGRAQRRALDNLQQGMGDMAEQMRNNTAAPATARTSPRSRSASGAARTATRSAAPTATSATRSTPASTRCRSSSSARRAARSSTSCAAAPASMARPKEELDYIDRLLKTY